MRSLAALTLTLSLAASAAAGPQEADIDRDVWIPFMAASNAFDAEGFLAVQSKDLVRVAVDQGEVYGLDRYTQEIRDGFKRARERGLKRTSEARFVTRVASETLAHETGFFKSQATLANGEVRTRYSRFEFILRKENGRWKILVDKDTVEGAKLTEPDFQTATPIGAPAKAR